MVSLLSIQHAPGSQCWQQAEAKSPFMDIPHAPCMKHILECINAQHAPWASDMMFELQTWPSANALWANLSSLLKHVVQEHIHCRFKFDWCPYLLGQHPDTVFFQLGATHSNIIAMAWLDNYFANPMLRAESMLCLPQPPFSIDPESIHEYEHHFFLVSLYWLLSNVTAKHCCRMVLKQGSNSHSMTVHHPAKAFGIKIKTIGKFICFIALKLLKRGNCTCGKGLCCAVNRSGVGNNKLETAYSQLSWKEFSTDNPDQNWSSWIMHPAT